VLKSNRERNNISTYFIVILTLSNIQVILSYIWFWRRCRNRCAAAKYIFPKKIILLKKIKERDTLSTYQLSNKFRLTLNLDADLSILNGVQQTVNVQINIIKTKISKTHRMLLLLIVIAYI
jgi:hypothetical protein